MATQFSAININLGTLLMVVIPLGGAVWGGAVWASELEAHIQRNSENIEQLVEVVKANAVTQEQRNVEAEKRDGQAVEIMDKLNQLLEREVVDGD